MFFEMNLKSSSTIPCLPGPAVSIWRVVALSRLFKRFNRRPCKLVCFKENTSDRIDDSTTSGRPTSAATPGGAAVPPRMYGGTDPAVYTSGLRMVNVGPVASVMYPVLQYGTLAAAAAAILVPDAVCIKLFQQAAPTAVHRMLIVCMGASLIPMIISKGKIKTASDSGILASPTYKQMVSASLLHGVMGLVVLSQAVSLRSPQLAGTVGVLMGLATITSSYTLMKIRESGQLIPSARGLLGGLLSLLIPANMMAAAFSLVSMASIISGTLMFLSDPTTPSMLFILPKDPVHVFCTRMIGAAMLANAVLLFTIKQAADDGRQGNPVHRDLSGAVATYSIITAGVLGFSKATGWAQSVPAFWGLLGTVATTGLLCGYTWASGAK